MDSNNKTDDKSPLEKWWNLNGRGRWVRVEGIRIARGYHMLPTITEYEEYMEWLSESDPVLKELFESKRFCEESAAGRGRAIRYGLDNDVQVAHSYAEYIDYCAARAKSNYKELDRRAAAAEFGCWRCILTKLIAPKLTTKIHGFDTFTGPPEDWKMSETDIVLASESKLSETEFGLLVGSLPESKHGTKRIVLHEGLFEFTLEEFLQSSALPFYFVHMAADLYSSTDTVLTMLGEDKRIIPGTVILLDKFYSYPNYKNHEYKAFLEFVDKFNVEYEWIAHTSGKTPHNGQQAALEVKKIY